MTDQAQLDRLSRDIVNALVRSAQIEGAHANAIMASIDVLSLRIERLTTLIEGRAPEPIEASASWLLKLDT